MSMTKEQYYHDVQYNHGSVLYEMYKEKFDHSKHKPFLQFQEFMMYLQMSGMINQAFERACQYYEDKFNITRVYDKNGKLIKLI